MTEKKDNVVLIGMPGVGKSTIGVIAAKQLGLQFMDADLLIQLREGRRLSQIIEEDGVDRFLEIEEEVNASIEIQGCVIATGGSVIYGHKAMEHLRQAGTVVYLRLSFDELQHRLGDLNSRGVVLREGQTLADLYAERTPLYEKYADIVVDEDGLSMEQTREAVERSLADYTSETHRQEKLPV